MNASTKMVIRPAVLAPAGNKASFLAAVAAEADAIYCGLKQFSARMEAKNFSLRELIPLVELAHTRGIQVYITLNSLLKPDDLDLTGCLLNELSRWVKPDALIIQDLALVPLVRQAGFAGQIHLSTLTNVSFSKALKLVRQKLRIDRVVLPRELNIDEIKTLAQACPPDLGLELFVHGALCYGVSGRCYWSSYLGGKSGLRGRCVQPCRRLYTQNEQNRRFFSCQDLSLDVLVKVLLSISQVRAWKIEGRKKGPHYVYYTVQGYRMLRDHVNDPQMKKNALRMLSRALGRTGSHYYFLPQRPQHPVGLDNQTGSGLVVGKMKGTRQQPYFVPREALLPGDVLRLGYEDEAWHSVERIGRFIPKGGRFNFKSFSSQRFAKGAPIFLTDRREKALDEMITTLEDQLNRPTNARPWVSTFKVKLPLRSEIKEKSFELNVCRQVDNVKPGGRFGLWLSSEALTDLTGTNNSKFWWWLPPVVWPEEEKKINSLVDLACKTGARNFVLNSLWQTAFFGNRNGFHLWAGPFCNLSNALAINTAKSLGFVGAIVSPELGREDYMHLALHRPMPLGIVIDGNWPLCVSRTRPGNIKPDVPFTSPKGEQAWLTRHGRDYWLFPNWRLDLRARKNELQKAGFTLFVHLIEPLPKTVRLKKRPGIWNWNVKLL